MLRSEVARIAGHYVGTRESGGVNRGKEVDRFNRTARAPLGSFWCMSFAYTATSEACAEGCITNPLMPTGSVWQQLRHASRLGSNLIVMSIGSRLGASGAQCLPGDIGCMSSQGTDDDLIGRAWPGHAFIVTADQGDSVASVDGNSNRGGSRNGTEVVRKRRRKDTILAVIRLPDVRFVVKPSK